MPETVVPRSLNVTVVDDDALGVLSRAAGDTLESIPEPLSRADVFTFGAIL